MQRRWLGRPVAYWVVTAMALPFFVFYALVTSNDIVRVLAWLIVVFIGLLIPGIYAWIYFATRRRRDPES